jgi:predicted GNAT superfamily acetyltransferase
VDGGDRLEFSYRLGRRPGFEVMRHIPPRIRSIEPDDHLFVIALNLESEHFLSPMNGRRLEELLDFGGCHRVLEVDGQVVAFIIALESGATYDSQNYQWFNRDRSEFVYVDRVVVSAQHRGRGYASALYDEVFGFAREQVRREVVCEFNLDPPNPASQAFHASYGFAEVGTREAGDRILSMQSATLRQR